MVRLLATALPLLAALAGLHAAADALSIPTASRSHISSHRAAAITKLANQIPTGHRALTIDGAQYPIYHGPIVTPGSLVDTLQIEESKELKKFMPNTPEILAGLAMNMSARMTTFESYTELYDQAEQFIEWPMSTDNSDETFGLQRVTIKAFALREAAVADIGSAQLTLPDKELQATCGYSAQELVPNHALFVEDYHDVAQYNDPKRPDKYIPNVVGFFCANKHSGDLLPVEIRMVDTKLAYTSLDTPEEWALAKMALEAASVAYHQMQHMVETHAVTIPLRAEAMRTMSEEHPVRALLEHHTSTDFGLERQAAVQLLNTSTLLDQILGWGATGGARFLYAQTNKGLSMRDQSFYVDRQRRGLHHLNETHKYSVYGEMYQRAISDFVEAYVDAYYGDDAVLTSDFELQSWAKAGAAIPHVHDFPSVFASKHQLAELLTHLIFTSTVRHHGMNGQATWHGTSAPYAPAALWKPLPSAKLRKGDKLNVLEYTAPPQALPAALAISSIFYREVPSSQTVAGAYATAPFRDEPQLARAIRAFDAALQAIEDSITKYEAAETWPYLVLRPSQLPHNTWI